MTGIILPVVESIMKTVNACVISCSRVSVSKVQDIKTQ